MTGSEYMRALLRLERRVEKAEKLLADLAALLREVVAKMPDDEAAP